MKMHQKEFKNQRACKEAIITVEMLRENSQALVLGDVGTTQKTLALFDRMCPQTTSPT